MKIFNLQTLLLSACFLVMIACTEDTQGQNKGTANPDKGTEQKVTKPVQQDNGDANFEAGLQAADANNMPLAYQEFLAAAEKGNIFAQFNIALMYEQGLGIDKNEQEAVVWYEKAALQGSAAAQFNLGVLYENGVGTEIDYAKANEWYRKASLQGDGLAIGNLGMLYVRGQGVPENKIAGVALLLLSATVDTSPENQARNNITATRGLTVDMVNEAQALSDEMSEAGNLLEPLDYYLSESKHK